MEDGSLFYGFKNIFITMFATFLFFKLLIKVFLALLTHFYVVKGNRKEAARIAEEIYGGISGKKLQRLSKSWCMGIQSWVAVHIFLKNLPDNSYT